MKNKNYIYKDLKEISPFMLQLKKTNVYYIPSSYFNDLSPEIIKKINLAKELLHNLSLITPFQIPSNYFENLSKAIFKKLYVKDKQLDEVFEETEAIAPLLNTISKKTLYSIPQDFFEKSQMPHIESKKQEAKVVSIYNWPKIFKISAAVIILSFSIKLLTIPEKSSVSSVALNNARKKVKNLSKQEIIRFLKFNVPAENITSAAKHKFKNENAIKSSLKEVSDKEIQQYLIETGESDEI